MRAHHHRTRDIRPVLDTTVAMGTGDEHGILQRGGISATPYPAALAESSGNSTHPARVMSGILFTLAISPLPDYHSHMATTAKQTLGQRIGGKIRTHREAKGWSQSDLASKIGRLQSQISEWENGVNEPQLSTLIAIASALKVDVGQLLAR